MERIFDIGAFTVLMALAIFFLPDAMNRFRTRSITGKFRDRRILAVMGLVAGLVGAAVIIGQSGEAIASWVEKRFAHSPANLGHRIAERVREFGAGLRIVHGPISLTLSILVSLAMWFVIAVAYQEVTHCLRNSRPGYLTASSADLDGGQYLWIDASVARRRWGLTSGNDRSPHQNLRCGGRKCGKLRNPAVAGDVCFGGTGRPDTGASRALVVAEVVGGESPGRGTGLRKTAIGVKDLRMAGFATFSTSEERWWPRAESNCRPSV